MKSVLKWVAGGATVAVALTAISGCVTQQSIDAERYFQSTIPTCAGAKDCEFKWAAARRWMLSRPTMKLQHYTSDYMETFNATGDGIGGRVTKDPVDDVTYKITVEVVCSGFYCFSPMAPIKQSFNDYLNGKVTALPVAPKSTAPGGHPMAR